MVHVSLLFRATALGGRRSSSEPAPDLLPERRLRRLLRVVRQSVDVQHQVQRIELQAVEVGRPAAVAVDHVGDHAVHLQTVRSEEHTSELQSLMRISYAVFCLKKQKSNNNTLPHITH